jgi:A/G-specific adenine glycosylase
VRREELLSWYRREGRDLPWRQTRDPYAVWVSEIMLQQTQVATALPYYERWMRRYPSVEALAAADEQDALSLWQGLGYYRRCRNLLAGARHILQHGCPTNASEWLLVPGVGSYTAAAISSICTGEAVAVVDGNVKRVFARFAASCETGGRLERAAWTWAADALDAESPADWNQAVMELGARICTPRAPSCDRCPISSDCAALARGLVAELPRKAEKLPGIDVVAHVLIPVHEGAFGVRQVAEGPWWRGLWEFPRFENAEALASAASRLDGYREQELPPLGCVVTRHKIKLEARLVVCRSRSEELSWHEAAALEALPMPAPQRKLLKTAQTLLSQAPAA